MTPLFSPEGERAIAALARGRTLFGFDFDGTLAPIVARPDDAFASVATIDRLARLNARVPVVILTGRSVADVRRRLDFEPRHVVGNHGAEGLPGDAAAATAERAVHERIAAGWRRQWADAIVAVGDDPGIVVEDKGASLSVHYRAAADPGAAERAVHAAAARLDPRPRLIGGKRVVNLLPEGAADKGRALDALVRFEGADTAFYIGDDTTDEVAFAQAPDHWMTVRIGPADASAARWSVDGQADIDRVLDRLLAHVATAGGA